MPDVTIPQALAQALYDYLLTRPMGEVERMAVALRQAKPVEPAPEAEA